MTALSFISLSRLASSTRCCRCKAFDGGGGGDREEKQREIHESPALERPPLVVSHHSLTIRICCPRVTRSVIGDRILSTYPNEAGQNANKHNLFFLF